MLAHGLVSPALFIAVTVLYDRHKTRLIKYYCGVGVQMPQVELQLLRGCLSVCKVIHMLHCLCSSPLGFFLLHFDFKLQGCLTMLCSISDNVWLQTTLSFWLGGLGSRDQHSANPAFLGSCNLTCF